MQLECKNIVVKSNTTKSVTYKYSEAGKGMCSNRAYLAKLKKYCALHKG